MAIVEKAVLSAEPTGNEAEDKAETIKYLSRGMFIAMVLGWVAAVITLQAIGNQLSNKGDVMLTIHAGIGIAALLSLASYLLYRLGKIKFAGYFLVITILVHVSLIITFQGSVISPIAIYYLFPILVAPMVINIKAGFFAATMAVILYLTLAGLENAGLLPRILATPSDEAISLSQSLGTQTALFFIAAFLSWYAASRLNRALLNTRRYASELQVTNDKLKASEEELMVSNDELEDRVSKRTSELELINEELEKERKKVEAGKERLEDIIDNMPDGVAIIDASGKIIEANKTIAEMYGYDTPDEMTGKTFSDYVAGEDIPCVAGSFTDSIAGKTKSIRNIDSYSTKSDGTRFPIAVNITNLWDEDDEFIFDIALIRDITERKQMEQELIGKTREVERANRMKSEFLANMSHELRNPLNVIIGFSELLADEVPGKINEEQRQCLEDVLSSGQHLLNLINGVLDISRIESGKVELKAENVDITEVISSLTRTVIPILKGRKQSLETEIQDVIPLVYTDEGKISQVLLNLLDNASKFTPDGKVLKIKAKAEDDRCVVSVIDSGIGIRKEDQESIFEPFSRLESTLSRERGGTGLGLTLVKQIIERCGGRIWLDSEYGKGSSFTFTLPLASVSTLSKKKVKSR